MPWKNFDYGHYLRNHELQPNQMLQPIFEAIENGFQSIEDDRTATSTVKITINRDVRQRPITHGDDGDRIGTPPDVISIEVADAGIGFSDVNWKAFETLSTSNRQSRDGKGMGRLLYCVPFGRVEFESTYREGGKLKTRTFCLTPIKTGTSASKITDAAEESIPETTAVL